MKAGSFWIGLLGGLGVGYALARTVEARARLERPEAARTVDARAYAPLQRRLAVGSSVRGLAASYAFAYGPTGRALDAAVGSLPVALRPAAFSALAVLGGSALDLPVAFCEDHGIERDFALSEQSARDWLRDYVKGALIGTALAAALATPFGWSVRRFPRAWPALASLGSLPLPVLANLVVPLYVMPLFNRFEPLTGPMETRLRALAARFGVGEAEILRMDMSKQTKKANAFVTGIGRTHRIVVGDTLLDGFTEDEVNFVVAHELGHYVAKDTWRSIALGQAFASALFTVAAAALASGERERLRERPLLLARLAATMALAAGALRPALLAFSRSREWAADRFAVAATGDAEAGAAAFRRLRERNLADEDPPAWYAFLFSTHPSLKDRIAALSQKKAKNQEE